LGRDRQEQEDQDGPHFVNATKTEVTLPKRPFFFMKPKKLGAVRSEESWKKNPEKQPT